MSVGERQRVFVFQTEEKSKDGRPYLMAFPESQITSLKTIWGGQCVYLEVNGIRMQESFEDVVKALGERVNAWETPPPPLTDDEIDALWDKEAAYYALHNEARGFARALINLLK